MSKQALVQFVEKKQGLTLLDDNTLWTNRVQVKSETSTRLYIVAQNKATGSWGCSCPGWIRYRSCKHLRSFVPAFEALLRDK